MPHDEGPVGIARMKFIEMSDSVSEATHPATDFPENTIKTSGGKIYIGDASAWNLVTSAQKTINNLIGKDLSHLRRTLELVDFGYKTTKTIACENCGTVLTADLTINENFFRSE